MSPLFYMLFCSANTAGTREATTVSLAKRHSSKTLHHQGKLYAILIFSLITREQSVLFPGTVVHLICRGSIPGEMNIFRERLVVCTILWVRPIPVGAPSESFSAIEVRQSAARKDGDSFTTESTWAHREGGT